MFHVYTGVLLIGAGLRHFNDMLLGEECTIGGFLVLSSSNTLAGMLLARGDALR